MSEARALIPPLMTVDEFVAWPGDGVTKTFQLIEGVAVAMSPGSATHGTIQATLALLIGRRLAETGSRCIVVTEPAVVPRIRSNWNMRVPDIGVTCTPVAAGQFELPDPILLVEILSPSNQNETRANIWAYATLPSVQELLIVRPTRVEAELLRRGPDGVWPDGPAPIAADGTLRLETVNLTCPLRAAYAGTHLA